MRINSVNGVAFGRAYTNEEKREALTCMDNAKKILGNKKVILIVPEQSLPMDISKPSGVGQLNSKSTRDFIDFMKTYTGITTLKVLPQGELFPTKSGLYCNYSSSSMTIGSHSINLEELTTAEMGEILSKDTLKLAQNKFKNMALKNTADFENVIGAETVHNKALSEAYENLKTKDSPKIQELRQAFEKYKIENSIYLEKEALYETLAKIHNSTSYSDWPEQDKNLFNKNLISDEIRNNRINELKTKHAKEIDFVYFKQFLADEGLKKARLELNSKGIPIMGDCLIGFSHVNIWGYPHAFEQANICSEEWGIRALNYSNITTEGSESNKLLKQKVEYFAKRYDEIRFDVGWGYVNPVLFPKKGMEKTLDGRYVFDKNCGGYRVKNYLNDDVIKIIENTVKSVKGNDYNLNNLIYEIEAGQNEFGVYDWNKNQVIDAFKNRTIVQSSCYMDKDYATVDFIEKRMKIPRHNYVYMSGNHDHLALNSLARRIDTDGMLKANGDDINIVLERQYEALAKALKKSESAIRKSPEEFVKSKFSLSFLAENVKLFFIDVFGRNDQFDSQMANSRKNYRQMIEHNYQESFFESIRNKKGLNIMEALAEAMKAKNLHEENSKVYNDLIKFANILKEKGISKKEVSQEEVQSTISKNNPSKSSTFKSNKIFPLVIGLSVVSLIVGGAYVLFNERKNKQKQLG